MKTSKKITFNQLKRLVSNPRRSKFVESRRLGRGKRLVRESDEDVSEEVMEALREHGNEYLTEHNPDSCCYSMDEMDELLSGKSVTDILNMAFFGCKFNPYADQPTQNKENFNPNDDYFTFNGYANLVSISEYDLDAYYKYAIDIDEFIEWARREGYLDEEEDEEEDEE